MWSTAALHSFLIGALEIILALKNVCAMNYEECAGSPKRGLPVTLFLAALSAFAIALGSSLQSLRVMNQYRKLVEARHAVPLHPIAAVPDTDYLSPTKHATLCFVAHHRITRLTLKRRGKMRMFASGPLTLILPTGADR